MAALQEAHKEAHPHQGPDRALVEKALDLLKQATELDENLAPAQAQYGLSLMMSGAIGDLPQLRRAAGHLAQALRSFDPADPAIRIVRMGYGDCLFALDDLEPSLSFSSFRIPATWPKNVDLQGCFH